MLISVHLPKTAGTSFRKSLESFFGERLFKDYGDRPINTPPCRRYLRAAWRSVRNWGKDFGAIDCVHGHFLPLKYLSLRFSRKARFVTWMRDPAERLVSHYYFFQRKYTPEAVSRLQRKMVEEQWSLEQFCLCPELRNFYCQFMWGVTFSSFDFIGIVEHYDDDIAYFAREFLGGSIPAFQENVNAARQRQGYALEPELRARIERYHAKDFALYRRALERRRARLSR